MLTRFQLDARITNAAIVKDMMHTARAKGDLAAALDYQDAFDHAAYIIASEIDLAVDAALAINAALSASQIAAQPVSLVKSAPATYCTGSALPTRAHPASYFTSTLRRNNLYLFAIACSKSV